MDKTIIITDGKYRSSLAAIRAFANDGYNICVTQTSKESKHTPPSFYSSYVNEAITIEGSVEDNDYKEKLSSIIRKYERPILFCVGAKTLNMVAENIDYFEQYADFIISEKKVLDDLNDKEKVQCEAEKIGIKTPPRFISVPDEYPVILKPHCGEKFNLTAKDRYIIANNQEEYYAALDKIKKYDPQPIVQKKVSGNGIGVSLLIDKTGKLISAICHKRIREYPISGGPSTCCESIYNKDLIEKAYRLLNHFGFSGLAMVEFKGEYLLEVNPRVWGSFSLTYIAESDFCSMYAKASAGLHCEYNPQGYKTGSIMRYSLNDSAATFKYLMSGNIKYGLRGIKDSFKYKDALKDKKDPIPYKKYLRNTLKEKIL